MEKMSFMEFKKKMMLHNKNHPESVIKGVIVYSEDNFCEPGTPCPYSLESRSYEVRSDSKAFKPQMIGTSLFGTSLDRTDCNVRLDWYDWAVDYCYFPDEVTSKSTESR